MLRDALKVTPCSRVQLCNAQAGMTHDDVGHEAEDQEGEVGWPAPAGVDDLQDRVGGRRFALDLNGQDAKQDDLDGGARSIPARHSIDAGSCRKSGIPHEQGWQLSCFKGCK